MLRIQNGVTFWQGAIYQNSFYKFSNIAYENSLYYRRKKYNLILADVIKIA
jgi:hypothetical protein